MASLAARLPAPRRSVVDEPSSSWSPTNGNGSSSTASAGGSRSHVVPKYGTLARASYRPVREDMFGDGGALPEWHVMQYPRGMGKKKQKSKALALHTGADGTVKYDAIIRQNMRKDQVVYSKFTDLIEKTMSDEALARPSEEEEKRVAERTAAALGKIIDRKLAAAQPTHVKGDDKDPTYVRYTPSGTSIAHANSGAKQRLIRIQTMPRDPLEPPKFRHKKVPNTAPSPPAPVMHSPPRKLTAQDQQNWKIPPCVSNWKNIKGYVIPLDKRLAADGRGLQEVQVNKKFVHLSEALYQAEQAAREDIELRNKLQSKIHKQEKKKQEENLMELARKAREAAAATSRSPEEMDEDAVEARKERDQLRRERGREIEREYRMESMKDERRQAANRVRANEDRDVSEKIALGYQPKQSADSMFDQRLFNQSSGMDQGFGADDSYSAYDKPLFRGSSATYMYKPSKNLDSDVYGDGGKSGSSGVSLLDEKSTSKFKPTRGFEGSASSTSRAGRDKPVQFERDTEEEDPFGSGSLLGGGGSGRRSTALDSVGKRGHMSASGGGARGQEYSRSHDGSREVEFTSSSSRHSSSRRRSRSRSRSRSRDRKRRR